MGGQVGCPEDEHDAADCVRAGDMPGLFRRVPVDAQIQQHSVWSATALRAAEAASEHRHALGHAISITIVGVSGEIALQLRDDGTGPHTVENSFRKVLTAQRYDILNERPAFGIQPF